MNQSTPMLDTVSESSSTTANTAATDESLLSQRLLPLVLISGGGKVDDWHAIVPFPKTYEDAMAVAIKVFKVYVSSGEGEQANLQLCRSVRNRKGEWIWADILPDQWEVTVTIGSEVGLRLHGLRSVKPWSFVHGPLHFVYVWDDGHGIEWPTANPSKFQEIPVFHHTKQLKNGLLEITRLDDKVLDRPKSYSDAVKAVRAIFASNARELGEKDTFTFCIFSNPNLTAWQPMPDEVRTDVSLWCGFLPVSGQILGLIINRKA